MPNLEDFYLTAEEIASLIVEEGVGPDDSLVLELEAELDALGAELGVCDLNPVAEDLLYQVEDELANLGILGRTAVTKRSKDPRRRYKGVCVRPDKRLAIYLRDKFCCVYCEADLHGADPFHVTLEHIKPHSEEGTNVPENLVTACRSCNCERQAESLRSFATVEARNRIRRNIRRSFKKYRVLAKAMLAGEIGFEQAKAAEFISVGEYLYRKVRGSYVPRVRRSYSMARTSSHSKMSLRSSSRRWGSCCR